VNTKKQTNTRRKEMGEKTRIDYVKRLSGKSPELPVGQITDMISPFPLNDVLDATTIRLYILDREKKLQYISKAARHNWEGGIPPVLGKPMSEMQFPGEVWDIIDAQCDAVFASGKPYVGNGAYSKQNKMSYFEYTIDPLRQADGSIEYIVITSHNVTQQRIYEERIAQLNQDLENRVMERTEMLERINQELEREIEERKLAEEILRQAEKKYRDIFENSALGIFQSTLDGRLINVNPAYARILGYDSPEDVYKSINNIAEVLYAEPGRRQDIVKEIVESDEIKRFENVYKRKDGKKITVTMHARIVRDENGEPLYLEGFKEDTTEHKRIEKIRSTMIQISEAALSSKNLQELFKLIHKTLSGLIPVENFYIATYNREDDLLEFPYYKDEFDETPERKKPGRGLTEYILRTGKPKLVTPEVFRELIESEEVESIGADSVDWLGVPLIVNDNVIGVLAVQSYSEKVRFSEEDKEILAIVSNQIAMAIERKQNEEFLRISEARYRAIVEDQTDLVTRFLADGILTFVNEATCHFFEKTKEELMGQSIYEYFSDENNKIIRNLITDSTPHIDQTRTIEISHLAPNGKHHWVQWTLRPLYNPQGEFIEFQAVGQNITERKQREEEMEAIVNYSSALRIASNRSEIIQVTGDEVNELFEPDGIALGLHDVYTDVLVFEFGTGVLTTWKGAKIKWENKFDTIEDLQSGSIIKDVIPDTLTINKENLSMACVPLIVQRQMIGALWVASKDPLPENRLSLLKAIGEIAANAIHRSTLHEQIELRLHRLTAIRSIDMAITASMDINITLNILLNQIITELEIDAADVLLLNPYTQTLDYTAGEGFITKDLQRTSIRLGEGYAGLSARSRKLISIPDLRVNPENTARASLMRNEDFITYHSVPLIAKGQIKGVMELFNRNYQLHDPEWLDFVQSVAMQAAIAIDNSELFDKLQHSNLDLTLAYDTTIEGWSRALDLRDKETEGHTQRVTELTLQLATSIGYPQSDLIHVRRGALLHDIGKMGIPDSILFKTGELTKEEWEIMRQHPVYAYEMLSSIPYLRPALDIPYCHHEKWDGSGYPRGLAGEKIPLAARIFAVVDVWDALISDRPYRQAWKVEQIRQYIRDQSGKHFEPRIVDAFLKIIKTD
jgi:PAS domain S-box-containing protein/putative nucleotidyltransferase with HDIG domain